MSAPRAYCTITKFPFFKLHFDFILAVLAKERLFRMTSPEYQFYDDDRKLDEHLIQRFEIEKIKQVSEILKMMKAFKDIPIPKKGESLHFELIGNFFIFIYFIFIFIFIFILLFYFYFYFYFIFILFLFLFLFLFFFIFTFIFILLLFFFYDFILFLFFIFTFIFIFIFIFILLFYFYFYFYFIIIFFLMKTGDLQSINFVCPATSETFLLTEWCTSAIFKLLSVESILYLHYSLLHEKPVLFIIFHLISILITITFKFYFNNYYYFF